MKRPWVRAAGYALGVLGLASGVWFAVHDRDALRAALDAARHAPAWAVASVMLLPIVNWLLSSGVFWVLTKRFGRVRPGEMAALIGSAWLLNYLPLRPGLLGRVAFHHAYHGIRVRDSARVVLEAIACGGVGLLAAVLLMLSVGQATPWARVAMLAGALALVAAPFVLASRARASGRPGEDLWRALGTATLLKTVDSLVWFWRYVAAFVVVGVAISPSAAAAVAAGAQAAMLVPLAGNGLGVREWVIGLITASLPDTHAQAAFTGATVARGLSADLANRAAEIAAAVAVGVPCTVWIARRATRAIGRDPGAPRAVPPTENQGDSLKPAP